MGTCVTPMGGDGATCATAIDLVFTPDASATVTGDTRDAGNDNTGTQSSCEVQGPDRVYRFNVGEESVGEFTMTAGYPAAVVLHGPSNTCATAPRLGCLGTPAMFPINIPVGLAGVRLAPGAYWLWADGPVGGGPYTLRAELQPKLDGAGEDCSAPIPLTFTGNTATVTGSTVGRINDTRSMGCAGGRGDVVYSFSVPTAGPVTAQVTTTNNRFEPVVYFRSSCAGPDIACRDGTQALSATLDAGTYFVWVDGRYDANMATDGEFTLTVTR